MRFLLSTVCLLSIFGGYAKTLERKEACPDEGPRSMRASVRYTSPDGIGYKSGYSTVEGFFSRMYDERWLPFLDLRGHAFDNGQLAANAGLGVRYLAWNRVWGINSYYDYRNTSHQHYNQVAAGLETLGIVWDLRINGYLPVGKKESPLRNAAFDSFSGHAMYINARRDSALRGANLEAGLHVDQIKSIPFYFAGGPFYLNGKGATTWGGQLRASAEFFHRYFRLEGNVSYDHIFKWIGQGQASVNVPFGRREKMRNAELSCEDAAALYARMEQRVDRNEIIPTAKTRVKKVAIDPATGKPYYFVFVNNMSSSSGTFESPYPSLIAAHNNSTDGNIIYVFPGDGSTTNMSTGITLQTNQMLLGASNPYNFATTLGNVTVPAFASNMPVFTNTTSNPVITLSSGNTVSGIYIENANGNGIYGSAITNFTATNNYLVGGGVSEGVGEAILLSNASGQININNNYFSQVSPSAANGYAVHIAETDTVCDVNFGNNTMICTYSGNQMNGFFADLSGTGAIGTLNVTNCNLATTEDDDNGIVITLAGDAYINNVNLTDVTLFNWDYALNLNLTGSGSIENITVANSNFNGDYDCIYTVQSSSGSIENLTVSNSTFTGSGEYAIYCVQSSTGSITNLTFSNCNFSSNDYNFYSDQSGSASITNLTFSNCSMIGGSYGLYHDLSSTSSIVNYTLANTSIGYASSEAIYADIEEDSSISNLNISNCNFTNIGSEVFDLSFSADGALGNLTISNSSFIGNAYVVYLDGGSSSIDTLSVTNSSFTNNEYCLYLDLDGIETFNVSNSSFTGNEYAFNSYPAIEDGLIANNQFTGGAYGFIDLSVTSTLSNSLSIVNNNFTGVASPSAGYAAYIATSSGSTLCLNFVGNSTIPTSQGGHDPYSFVGTSGTFNITSASTQANNTGIISTTGTIGSCDL